MAEYIEREALERDLNIRLNTLRHYYGNYDHYTDGFDECVDRVENYCSAADVVEVVRCRECKHWLKDVPGCPDFVGRCNLANYMIGAAGYCLYGGRRGDDA